MGKKIIWSSTALKQLEDIHFYILFESKSLQIADRVVGKIFDSTAILKTQAEVYEIDKQKKPKDVNFRTYFVYNYKVSYHITEEKIKFFE
jgi:plasmid stabilization system protein ParE